MTGAFLRIFHAGATGARPLRNVECLLQSAVEKSKSTDGLPVARALAGMKGKGGSGEDIEMRASDGALQQALYIAQWTRAGGPGVKYAQEGTGHGFKTVRYLEPKLASMPTTCKMTRP